MAEVQVRFEGVGKRYGKLWALRDTDLSFVKGEVVMLIGPNASGKTTLIKCLLGLVRCTEGRILVEGRPIGNDPGYRRSIGYMPQISQFPSSLTVGQLLEMMKDIRSDQDIPIEDHLSEELGLNVHLEKHLGTLSGGTRQKVSAVLAFRSRPRILVMDEPTAGLDPLSAHRVLREAGTLRDAGATVLITSHLMGEVESLADRVAYLEDGRLRFIEPVSDILATTGADRLAQAIPLMLGSTVVEHDPA